MNIPKLSKSTLARTIAILFGIAPLAFAQLNRPPIVLPGPPSPRLTAHAVHAVIDGQVARVSVEQTFVNASSSPLEGTYLFPLPKDAGVSEFRMLADGRVLEGDVLDQDEASKIYEEIVRRQLDPALLEYAGQRLFKVRIFPIPPHGERKITLNYSLLLAENAGLVLFSHPLAGQIVGDGPVVKGMSERAEPVRPEVSVTLRTAVALKNIYSPSHAIEIQRTGDREAEVRCQGGTTAARHFNLYYSVSREELGISLITHRPESNEDGFFMLLVSPEVASRSDKIPPKDYLFVLDISGSMEGEKLDQAKAALRHCIGGLKPEDRFNVIVFSSGVRRFEEGWVPARSHRQAALDFVSTLEAGGGTYIEGALAEALQLDVDSDRPASLLFLTDGLPTVGESDAGRLVQQVQKKRSTGMKIFTFGVGYDVNTLLLDGIAASTQSVSDYIEPGENIEERVSRLFDKIRFPLLTDLTVQFQGLRVHDLVPVTLPDLHRGEQLTLLGRYGGQGSVRIEIDGKAGSKVRRMSHVTEVARRETSNDFLPLLWATRKIGLLMDTMRLQGDSPELREEIVALSKRYGVLSPLTAYLVREEGQTLQDAAAPMLLGGSGANVRAMNVATAPSVSGAQAVQMSKGLREMKEAEAPAQAAEVRRVGTRTFFMRDGLWVDGGYTDEETVNLRRGSQALTELMAAYPEVIRFLGLGEKVLFDLKGRFVKVSDQGRETWKTGEMARLFR